jgi:hypothetical protein
VTDKRTERFTTTPVDALEPVTTTEV